MLTHTLQVVIRPIMVVALTYDHRLVDGREAVTFLKTASYSTVVSPTDLTTDQGLHRRTWHDADGLTTLKAYGIVEN